MYRIIDENIIIKNLDNLEENAATISMSKYEPTKDERNNVYSDIIKFIKEKKRIVYGGYAQNSLILKKNKDDGFYKESDFADIEFYSPTPVEDTIDLCDMLHRKKYKYVEGSEGVHNETYKIFVNFINYCDISYMPNNILKICPYIEIHNMKMCHPHFMLIDAFRVYTDPMTSYFRLRKTFVRFNTLIKHYPLDDKMGYNTIEYKQNSKETEILRYIRKHIIHNSKLIVIGNYAFNYIMKKSHLKKLIGDNFYQLISTDYKNDIDLISRKLKSKYSNVMIKKYNPFFQFLDKSTEFYVNNVLILRVYNAYDRCTVYHYSKKKRTYFASYMLLFMHNLIQYNIGRMKNNTFNINLYGYMLIQMIQARNKYLDKKNLTVLDKTIFQEFTLECIGEPKDILRESRLEMMKKRESGKQSMFRYKPKGEPGKKPNFKFDNSSGEQI